MPSDPRGFAAVPANDAANYTENDTAVAAVDVVAAAVVAAIRSVLPADLPAGPVPLHEPRFAGREWDYVKECIDTGWVSSAGKFVDRFEVELARTVDAAAAVATVNGTAALHAALLLAGVRPGDEVIVPSLTFVGTANAVSHSGAVPHFADVSEATLGLDPARLERHLARVAERRSGALVNRATGRVIRAIVPVHLFGHPVALDELAGLAAGLDLALVEDAAEALGSRRHDRPVGGGSRICVFSFNGNKTITTGGGGAIVTSDPALAAAAKHLTSTARLPRGWNFEHDRVGYNYRMPNINAALGCAQLEQLDGFIARKRALAARYRAAFAGVADVRFVEEPPHARSNYWLNAVLVGSARERDAVLGATHAAGIDTRPAWVPMHRLPMYRDCPRDDLPVVEMLADRIVNIPSGPRL